MKSLALLPALEAVDPQMMLSQIVYHLTHVGIEKEPNEWFSCLFLPGMSYLYAGVMQAMGYSMLSPHTRRVIIISQGEQKDSLILPESDMITPFLGQSFIFDKALSHLVSQHCSVLYDDTAIQSHESFWNHLPFLRVGFSIDSILPIIIPQNYQENPQLTAVLSQLLDEDGVAVVFSGELSMADNKKTVRNLDTKHLTTSIVGNKSDVSGMQLFDTFVGLSRTFKIPLSHLYYDDSQSIGYDTNYARGLLVSGF